MALGRKAGDSWWEQKDKVGFWGNGRIAPEGDMKILKGVLFKRREFQAMGPAYAKKRGCSATVRPRRKASVIRRESDEDSSWRWCLESTREAYERSVRCSHWRIWAGESDIFSTVTLDAVWRIDDGSRGSQEESQAPYQEVSEGICRGWWWSRRKWWWFGPGWGQWWIVFGFWIYFGIKSQLNFF